jgi:hypothetical protein
VVYLPNINISLTTTGSSNIIQMPLPGEPRKPNPQYDYLYDMFGTSEFSTPAQTPVMSGLSTPAGFTLVYRPRHIGDMPGTTDSDGYSSDGSLLSDFEGFSLLSRACASIESAAQNKSSQQSEATRDQGYTSVEGTGTGKDLHDSGCLLSGAFKPQEDHSFTDVPVSGSNDLSDLSDDFLFADEDEPDWSDFDNDGVVRNERKTAFACGYRMYDLEDAASSTETIVAVASALPRLGETSNEPNSENNATEDWDMPEASELAVAGQG